jgi:hypothetical protein
MRSVTAPRSPGLTALAAFAAAFHAATAVIVPLLHAQAEVLQSAQEVESSHGAQCPRLHAEGTCVVLSVFQMVPLAGARVELPQPKDGSPLAAPTQADLPQDDRSRNHPVRAPPSR